MIKDHRTELIQHLDVGENLIWTGQPKAGIVFRKADIFLIPFSLFWCGFVIFWETMAIQDSIVFAMFGIPFIIIGLIFVFGRFIIDIKQRKNTTYGLTEDRIVIKRGVMNKKIKSLNLRALSQIEYDEKNDGTGTISFGQRHPLMNMTSGMNWFPGIEYNPQFELIPDVRKVYNQIIELQKAK